MPGTPESNDVIRAAAPPAAAGVGAAAASGAPPLAGAGLGGESTGAADGSLWPGRAPKGAGVNTGLSRTGSGVGEQSGPADDQPARKAKRRRRAKDGRVRKHTCHKCSAVIVLDDPTAGLKAGTACDVCACTFHVHDCGKRYEKAGLPPEAAAECPCCSRACDCGGGPVSCYSKVSRERMRERRLKARQQAAGSAESPTRDESASAKRSTVTVGTGDAESVDAMSSEGLQRAPYSHPAALHVASRTARSLVDAPAEPAVPPDAALNIAMLPSPTAARQQPLAGTEDASHGSDSACAGTVPLQTQQYGGGAIGSGGVTVADIDAALDASKNGEVLELSPQHFAYDQPCEILESQPEALRVQAATLQHQHPSEQGGTQQVGEQRPAPDGSPHVYGNSGRYALLAAASLLFLAACTNVAMESPRFYAMAVARGQGTPSSSGAYAGLALRHLLGRNGTAVRDTHPWTMRTEVAAATFSSSASIIGYILSCACVLWPNTAPMQLVLAAWLLFSSIGTVRGGRRLLAHCNCIAPNTRRSVRHPPRAPTPLAVPVYAC